MNGLIRIIGNTLVRHATYKLSARAGATGGIVLAALGAVAVVATGR